MPFAAGTGHHEEADLKCYLLVNVRFNKLNSSFLAFGDGGSPLREYKLVDSCPHWVELGFSESLLCDFVRLVTVILSVLSCAMEEGVLAFIPSTTIPTHSVGDLFPLLRLAPAWVGILISEIPYLQRVMDVLKLA